MDFLHALYSWIVGHQSALGAFGLLALPSVITGLSEYPKSAGFVNFLKVIFSILSVVSHKDSPGTFKLPLTKSPPPVAILILIATMFMSGSALAQDPPPPPAPVTAPQRLFGGCNKKGTICLGPSIAITTHAWDITHKVIVPAFNPGLGYGVTFNQGRWDAFGFDMYLAFQAGTVDGMTVAGMFKFANGFARIGLAREIAGGRAAWLIPLATGFDL